MKILMMILNRSISQTFHNKWINNSQEPENSGEYETDKMAIVNNSYTYNNIFLYKTWWTLS